MNKSSIIQILTQQFSTPDIEYIETVQSLWSGYGNISRYRIGSQLVIIKTIDIQTQQRDHPRGWQSDFGHQRKLSSYLNELNFYQQIACKTDSHCRVPKLYVGQGDDYQLVFIMEDLNAQGFSLRYEHAPIIHNTPQSPLTVMEISPIADSVIKWLAYFHAQFMQTPALQSVDISQQWPQGSYWHLATRPDEYAKMPNSSLKQAAIYLDRQLQNATFQTLIHGDAKIANFCFGQENGEIAAVDFQYCGRGVGIVDVVYFLGSAFSSQTLTDFAPLMLDNYFAHIRHALQDRLDQVQLDRLEHEWRRLYPVAWADFERFLMGWSPGHHKLHTYSRTQTTLAIPPN
jgi:hypothetical protein